MNMCMQNDDYDKVIRKLIEKETDIVDTRIRWSFLMHSVLLTAYWKVVESANEDKTIYISILTIVGVCFSISSLYTVWSSERAIAFILSKWNDFILNSVCRINSQSLNSNYTYNSKMVGKTISRPCHVGLYNPYQLGFFDMHGKEQSCGLTKLVMC